MRFTKCVFVLLDCKCGTLANIIRTCRIRPSNGEIPRQILVKYKKKVFIITIVISLTSQFSPYFFLFYYSQFYRLKEITGVA